MLGQSLLSPFLGSEVRSQGDHLTEIHQASTSVGTPIEDGDVLTLAETFESSELALMSLRSSFEPRYYK
jgi:hypothetical protein